jgi:hypothetical protein
MLSHIFTLTNASFGFSTGIALALIIAAGTSWVVRLEANNI